METSNQINFSKNNQCKVKELAADFKKRQWVGQRFDHNSEVIHIGGRGDYGHFYTCCRAKPGVGVCCYAICEHCKLKATGADSGGRPSRDRCAKTTPNTEKHKHCCHGLQDLEVENEPWWCNPHNKSDGLFSLNWLLRVKGCVGCNKMFVNKAKPGWRPSALCGKISAQYEKLDSGEFAATQDGDGNMGAKKALNMEGE